MKPINNLFIITLKYLVPLEEILANRAAHIKFLEVYYKNNTFIASGPQVPRIGGVIIAKSNNKEDLIQILNNDPFINKNLAEYNIIEFAVANYSPELQAVLDL